MTGYIVANKALMSDERFERYRGFYCGLCLALKERYGNLPRLTLTYDVTYLIILLSSMHERETEEGMCRCAIHPLEQHKWIRNSITDYAADMSIALAYYDRLDDWLDDKSLSAKAEADALKKHYNRVKELHPHKCAHIEECMKRLSEAEKSPASGPDTAANIFGELFGDLFVLKDGFFAENLRAFGSSLGKFIYMMDAAVDLEEDIKKGHYNPFLSMDRDEIISQDERKAFLKILIGETAEIFEKLPLVDDVDILRNVLYSGVWMSFEKKRLKEDKKKEG